ncbi:MAG: amino acid ABC transporter permease [Oscillospiraceae bacterium]|nr:amino acid ABC transporter permease [Oscillospiraceae bacterium]
MTFSTMLGTMGMGMLRTCGIFFLTLLFSLPLGMIVMLLRRSRFKVVQGITKIFIAVMRGTPLMLQLLVWYFGPYYLFGWSIRGYRFTAIIIGFAMNYAAYFAEIYRGGIESIPVGQYEAAEVLGYSHSQTFFKIILPQVIKRILPAVTNEIITLVKDTSLAFTLAYNEVFSLAKQIAASQTSFMPFVIAGVFYFVANYAVAFGMERIEKAFDYYK